MVVVTKPRRLHLSFPDVKAPGVGTKPLTASDLSFTKPGHEKARVVIPTFEQIAREASGLLKVAVPKPPSMRSTARAARPSGSRFLLVLTAMVFGFLGYLACAPAPGASVIEAHAQTAVRQLETAWKAAFARISELEP